MTGPVDLVLFAASTAVDTDFAATLTDVYPDGRAIHICEGIRGVTFRESLEHPTPIEPGKSTSTRSACGRPATCLLPGIGCGWR